jgi:hypothetical protein
VIHKRDTFLNSIFHPSFLSGFVSELPHANAMRLPASTTDSISHDGVTEVLCPQA